MNKLITALALSILVFSMPFAFAQNLEVQSSAKAQSVSGVDLTFKKIGYAFGDFVFDIKSALTFDEKTKLDLLKERNLEMKERQQTWLDIKSEVLAEAKTNPDESKKEAVESIRAQHEVIIKEHLKLTNEIKEIQLKAKARGDSSLETKAKETADVESRSGLALGLNVPIRGYAGSALLVSGHKENLTEAEAKLIVEKTLGFSASEVRIETEGNMTVYVVTASDTKAEGGYTLVKEAEVKIDSETGAILSLDIGAKIIATSNLTVDIASGLVGSVKVNHNTNSEAYGDSDDEAEAESSLETSTDVHDSTSTSINTGSSSVSGGSSASASTGSQGGLHIG